MDWTKITFSPHNDQIECFDYSIRQVDTRIECEREYEAIWRLVIRDVLPLAKHFPWEIVGAYFRLEDGGGGIFFCLKDRTWLRDVPGVGISNSRIQEEQCELALAEDAGEISDESLNAAWNEARLSYAEMILRAAKAVDLPAAVDQCHKPFNIEVQCYDDVVCKERFE